MQDAHLFEIDIVRELHVLRVDAENLEAASGVRNADVDFSVKATESSKGRVH